MTDDARPHAFTDEDLAANLEPPAEEYPQPLPSPSTAAKEGSQNSLS